MAEGQHTNGAATAAEATPTAAPASAPPATQAAASQPAAPTPLPSMSTAPRPAAQQAAAPLPSAHAGSEKSLFPNSLPVRQSLPSIHSFGASHSPINAGPYGDSRARSAGTESKGATPNRFSASPSPYNPLPSLSNTGSPKLAAPTSATSQGAPHSSASPRLPGLTKLSPPAPAAATPPATTASPASYRNPMSVSSMLSGPSRDRPYGSVNSTGAASGASASPQPPVLPPAPSAHGGARKEESKHENGKATSPPVNPAMGGFRRPAEGSSASPAAKAGGQGRSTGGEKGSMSPAGGAGAAGGDKDAGASNSTANKTERSYPPLPSAFARESPYSTWASSSKKDQGFGARHDSASSKEASPPAPQGGAPKQAGKTFFPSNNSFSRPPPTTSTHRHSHSAGGPSFPPTFPWTAATLQQQQQQQQAQQQQAQQPQQQQQQQGASSTRSYPDFYHTNSADSLRAQEEKRKAEAASASHHPHSSQASAQQQQHRQGASQPHQSGKSHVRYPGSDAYSLGGRPGPTAPTAHVSATQDMPSWRTAESGATSTIPAPLNSSTSAHKRRRSEGVQSALRQEGGFADGKPKVVKTPFVPPFSLADQRKATVRPPLLNVRNDEVLKALALPSSPSAEADTKAPKRPFLGRVVYDPFVNPATLLDGQLLRSNVGGVVEVAISTGWFESSPFLSSGSSSSDPSPSLPSTLYEFGDPATYDGSPLSDVTADETDPRIPPSVWELEGIRKRKVWGSDVYTDDSDVLALLLHSGWLRLGRRKEGGQKLVAGEKGAGEQAVKASRIPWKGFAGEGEGEKKREGVKSLVVKLIVAPRLVRYQGCERMGLKSRSWGNGHDGVSLMVEGVDLADELLRPHGRRWTKRRLGDFVESLLPKDVAAPPSAIDVTLPRDGSSTPDDQEKLSVVDTFVLGPRNEDCSFVRTELSPVLANGAAAAAEGEAMELDVV